MVGGGIYAVRMALETSADAPIPVRQASRMLQGWIGRLGPIWVEGQIAELRRRRNQAYLTLRDTDANMSIPLVMGLDRLDGSAAETGQRIVARLKVEYWPNNGSVHWRASEVRPVGLGALMQRLEELRKTLAAEGLFADERKLPLPFLPAKVGLICGKRAAAHGDVVTNARDRWPATVFEVREVAVQGSKCVPEVIAALADLAGTPGVEVIVITRGGGSFEDLLGFSNEALVRAVSECRVPVVSAIGHEEDSPLLDLVADRRASTPTAAGKMVVPDAAEERLRVEQARKRLDRAVRTTLQSQRSGLTSTTARLGQVNPARLLQRRRTDLGNATARIRTTMVAGLARERTHLAGIQRHPALARPDRLIDPLREQDQNTLHQLRRHATTAITDRRTVLDHDVARLRALSPQGTLDRGYAVVRRPDGSLVTDAASVVDGEALAVRVRVGSFGVRVEQTTSNQED